MTAGVDFFEGGEGFGDPVKAVHAGVFPFDADGASVADGGQGPERRLPRGRRRCLRRRSPSRGGGRPRAGGSRGRVAAGLADLGRPNIGKMLRVNRPDLIRDITLGGDLLILSWLKCRRSTGATRSAARS